MIDDSVIRIVELLVVLLAGAFGKKLLDWWRDRDKQNAELVGNSQLRVFADNEQARVWLREQLTESENELKAVRQHERELMTQVADLATLGARNEERINAQALQIEKLEASFARLGSDYAEMKAERDAYRQAKHDSDQKLTAESLRAQLAQRDLLIRDAEIERLKGQVELLTATKDIPDA